MIAPGGNEVEQIPFERAMRRLAAWILRRRFYVLAFLILMTLLLGSGLRHFKILDTLSGQLPEDDPDLIFAEEFVERFGNHEIVAVGIEMGDIFTTENLEILSRLTERIGKVENVAGVLSLANATDMKGTEEGVSFEPLYREPPRSPEAIRALRERVLADPYWVNSIVSADGADAAITVRLPYLRDEAIFRIFVVDEIRAILDQELPEGMPRHIAGIATLGSDSRDSILDDMMRFGWMLPLFTCAILYFVFRAARGVLIPQAVIFTTVIWSLGLFFIRGRSFSWTMTILPVLIGVIAMSDVIHIISRYYEESARFGDRRRALKEALAHMIRPCFLTSTTTMVGFASLTSSRIIPVREFGLYAAVGLAFSYVLGITLTPILLSFLEHPGGTGKTRILDGPVTRCLDRIERLVERDTWRLPALTVLLVGLALVGISRLRVETQVSKFLPKGSPGVKAFEFFDTHFDGVSTLDLEVWGPEGVFKEPWALGELDRLGKFIEELPHTHKSISAVDLIKAFNKAMNAEQDEFYRIPDDRRTVAEYLFLFELSGESDLIETFLTYECDRARIVAKIETLSSAELLEFIGRIDAYTSGRLDPRLEARVTGTLAIYATLVQALVHSQVRSIFIAFAIIAVMMATHFRSVKVGLVSMIPNMIPIVLTLGMMGWLGISLNVATVMISCIALGIAVDDTIHYLSRFQAEYRRDGDRIGAMRRTITSTGRAIVYTSLVITGGFWILIFSSYRPNAHFGILTGITMLSALLADLLIAPLCVRFFKLGN